MNLQSQDLCLIIIKIIIINTTETFLICSDVYVEDFIIFLAAFLDIYLVNFILEDNILKSMEFMLSTT